MDAMRFIYLYLLGDATKSVIRTSDGNTADSAIAIDCGTFVDHTARFTNHFCAIVASASVDILCLILRTEIGNEVEAVAILAAAAISLAATGAH